VDPAPIRWYETHRSMGTVVIGTGMAVGEHRVPNAALARVCDTTDEWILERTGIRERYYVASGTAPSDLGVRAARDAIADAGLSPGDIDYLIVATMTPDYYFPGTATLVQTKLGLGPIPALDIRQQCTGFLHGIELANALLRTGAARRLLLIGTEVHSGFMPFDIEVAAGVSPRVPTQAERDFATRYRDRTVLFGDAAAAAVLTLDPAPDRGLVALRMHTDGSQADRLYVPSGFAFRPYVDARMIEEGRHIPEMDGHRVFKAAATRLPEVVREVLGEAELGVDDIDLLLAHQANLRICEAVQRSIGVDDAHVYNNIERYGNTTSATIPLLWHECRRSGRIKPGDLLCLVAFGAGFVWGAALLRA
jgi:3-oxoacyl-[acyl-carrier-protein] synthase III